jgi:iron only hydrogenase large subunit-like protein
MDFVHSLEINQDKCCGKLHCMRVCPTHAIRVKNGKAVIDPVLCIDCGDCILACPQEAIKSITDSMRDLDRFKFNVAIPSPTLFGQFQMDIKPDDIVEGLITIGFDAVHEISVESELINTAIQDYLHEYTGPFPLISSACPVVVRLIQVAYPNMVKQIIPIQPPREIAAREMKKHYAKETGLKESDIGAIYLTPCPSKMIAIKQPAEDVKSHLDLAIGISEIYNNLLSAITKGKNNNGNDEKPHSLLQGRTSLSWVLTGGRSESIKPGRFLTVAQMPNIIRIFDDIEKGKIRGIEFLECYACLGGCVGGSLTVEDTFVARSKIQNLITSMEDEGEKVLEDARREYKKGDYYISQQLEPRKNPDVLVSIEEQIIKMKIRENLIRKLPGIDCGLCGAPTCRAFAGDVSNGKAKAEDCVLLSAERLKELQDEYNTNKK